MPTDDLSGFDLGSAGGVTAFVEVFAQAAAVVAGYRAALEGEGFSSDAAEAMTVDQHRAFIVEFTAMTIGPDAAFRVEQRREALRSLAAPEESSPA